MPKSRLLSPPSMNGCQHFYRTKAAFLGKATIKKDTKADSESIKSYFIFIKFSTNHIEI